MRRVLLLAVLLPIAACGPRPAAYTSNVPPGTYTPPYPDLLRSAPPAATVARTPDPWNTDTERDFVVALFGATEAMACKIVPRGDAIELMVNIHLHPRFVAAISEARRKELRDFSLSAGMNSAPAGCNAGTRRFYAVLRDRYPSPPSTGRRPAATAPAATAPAAPGQADTGWQPGPNAPRPLPPAKPDQMDL